MSKLILIKQFNQTLDKFIDYLLNNFHIFKNDLILAKNNIELVRNSNPRLIVDNFVIYTKNHIEDIKKCNEDFFKLKSNKKIDENLLYYIINQIWFSQNISNIHKGYIWLYLQKLVKLSYGF